MSGVRTWRQKRGGPSVIPGRSGAAWAECRRRRYDRDGGRCQVCGGHVDKSLHKDNPRAWQCDHWPTPWRHLRRLVDSGQITEAEFARRANDPEGCRTVHRQCHEDRDLADTRQPLAGPTPGQQGSASQEW